MRKIVCQACENRYGDYGVWIVFDSVIICDTCRLTAIERVRDMGFGFDHVFVIELSHVQRQT